MTRARLLLLSPTLAMIGFFLLLPVALMAVYSFLSPGTYGGVEWLLSFDAYIQFFFERDFLTDELVFHTSYLSIYFRSFVQALAATVICLLIGFPTAYFIATRPPATRSAWVLLVTVPYWVNLLIRTVSMLFVIRDEGPLNGALTAVGIVDAPLRIAYTDFAIALGLVYSYLPFMVLPIYAAIERFDFSLMEAACDLYAGRWTILRRIILPTVKPGVVAGCLLVFIPSLGAYIAPDLLGGGKNLMIGNLVALQFQGSRNWPFGAAAAVLLLSVVLVALTVLARRRALSSAGN
ncbi:MAG: ABC transporter permease [Gammaproteobacteria bacterium]|nr:ABC transporter permease [Gammaproteobacteria bacterium]MDD9798882.1 ABC transporter permease [Gammaproteobacteria bacterium]MDD9815634.1 ABC transporter permease [Gammaproteobacteria bacterium]MDD9852294.1 ABC transporter permease [Gammaproteobacteria bacterium]MDD9871321.1 ABC transporter permease [Gammaproteobacteria bacterium]